MRSLRRLYATLFQNTLLRVQLVRSRAYTWENLILTIAFLGVVAGSMVRLAAWTQITAAIAELPFEAMPARFMPEFSPVGYWETVAQFGQIACIALMVLMLVVKAALLPWFTRYNFRVILNENYRMLPVSESQLIFALMDWKVAKIFLFVLVSFGLYFATPKVSNDVIQLVVARTALLIVVAGAAWVYRLGQSRVFLRDFIRTRLFWSGALWLTILVLPLYPMIKMNVFDFLDIENFTSLKVLYAFTTFYVFASAVPVPDRVAERMIESARVTDDPQEESGA